ncbi:M48 family metalloprotease [Neptuniibacter sp. SY11_33]|uniref:M48 family metalloprotease n=1 Tax=Neptuniibacter sp. SY11_33 TaxID=3398215 RepID=UPI0039F44776
MHNGLIAFLLTILLSASPSSLKADTQLPDIGGSGYSIITPQQEYLLGRAWVRMLRGSSRLYKDAVVSQYVEELTWNLVTYSQLTDRRLEIVVLDNPTVNAFAAPGGIIGVHTGLLLTAQNEAQLASVLAHELAHLSQRHFASQLEEQRRNKPFFIASLLGSILLAAADPEAGVVGMQSSMAASASSRLSFSRQNEREADYIGMQTLTQAGYDPKSMADMFSQLQQQARFSRIPPEFLLTHPVTQSRVSDALNRAETINVINAKENSIHFNIASARIRTGYTKDQKQLLEKYLNTQKQQDNDSLRYAIAHTAIAVKDFELAQKNINRFSKSFKSRLSARLIKAELELGKENYPEAAKQLQHLRNLFPGSQAVSFIYADTQIKLNQPHLAVQAYEDLVEKDPNDSRAWYLLAEAYGLAGDIVGVHEARVEYFLLTANVDRALRQIDYALREPTISSTERARLEQRQEDAKEIRESLKLDY